MFINAGELANEYDLMPMNHNKHHATTSKRFHNANVLSTENNQIATVLLYSSRTKLSIESTKACISSKVVHDMVSKIGRTL